MRHYRWLALVLCLLSGCADEGNQVIDTSNRRPPPDVKEMEDYNAAMEAAGKENSSP